MNKEELLNYFIKELSKGRLTESERSHLKEYISRNDFEPDDQILGKVSSTDILLLRAIFSNDIMMELLQEKQPGVDFGVWFENLEAGIKGYDTLEGENLLIAVPYGAANEPKPKGSRFDNTEVTIIATFKYLLSSVTEISKHPHIDFLVNAFKSNMSLEVLSDEERSTELIQSLIRISSIEDTASLGKAKVEFVEKYKDRLDELRIPLATLVCARQLSFDSYKASSNRTEQGNLDDEIIGFSGTSGDTSSFFKQVALDPLADAKVTFGIMARTNCQKTTVMVLGDDLKSRQYSKAVISKSLPFSGSDANKVFIDAGGYCKNSNRVIAEEILMHYEEMDKPLEGVVFYDDTTNTKTVLLRQDDKTFIQVPFDASYQKQVASKDSNFLTYYDQSHSRGADITQPDGCNAVITVSIGTSMNDFKQAALRMRKIVDCSSKQTFSLTFDEQFATKLTQELGDEAQDITTNDVAFWLRKQELKSDHDQVVGQFVQEMQAVAKNYILECI
jgi:hypothetical protein